MGGGVGLPGPEVVCYELKTHNILGLTELLLFISLSPSGLTWSLNGNSIPTNNISRISVYDFDENSGNNFDGSLRAESELPVTTVVFSNACIIGDGTSAIDCMRNGVGHITHFGAITRGWDTRREEENGRRVHYLRRRQQTPEEGYSSCDLEGDINNPVGVYILYPSEWLSLMI